MRMHNEQDWCENGSSRNATAAVCRDNPPRTTSRAVSTVETIQGLGAATTTTNTICKFTTHSSLLVAAYTAGFIQAETNAAQRSAAPHSIFNCDRSCRTTVHHTGVAMVPTADVIGRTALVLLLIFVDASVNDVDGQVITQVTTGMYRASTAGALPIRFRVLPPLE